MPKQIKATFDFQGVTLRLDQLLPIRQLRARDRCFGKYKSILASIREVGVVEPLVVHPQKGTKGRFLLLDGHMRLEALRELGKTEAPCIISKDDDAFTYNDKVSRLAVVQEHQMIMKAIDQGITPEQIARVLDVDLDKIKRGMNLLEGIHPEAVELLKDKPIPASAVRVFKKVKAVRQLDFAQLMISMNNYTLAYARALLLATPTDMLVSPKVLKAVRGVKAEDIVQMEKEMESLERDFKAYQDGYGENTLSLNVVQRYVRRLLDNPQVKRFLTKRYSEIHDELTDLLALETI